MRCYMRTLSRMPLIVIALASGSAMASEPVLPSGAAGGEEGFLPLQSLTLRVSDLFRTGGGGEAPAAAAGGGGAQYGTSYREGYFLPPLRFDVLLGAIVPFEKSGLAFGQATSEEDFDAGAMFGFRLQVGVTENFFIGGEIDFAAHDVDQGPVFFPGDLGRIYFLVPATLEQSFGSEDRPVTIGFSVAPGMQLVLYDVDHNFEDLQAFVGRFIDEDEFVAFTLRAAATIRIPIGWRMDFFGEVSYDWAYGEAEVEVRNSFGQLIERRSDEIDLSSLNAFAGFSFTF